MAESNAPEHKDRGLFGLLGKKEEENHDVRQQSRTPGPTATHAPPYTGVVQHTPPPVSHQPQSYGQGEGGKLNRSNSSSGSSSDEDESEGKKKEGKKKKGKKETRDGRQDGKVTKEEPEKKGMMEKIKEKLPGHKQ